MKQADIRDISDLLSVLKEWKDRPSIFRGMSSDQHRLLPSIGRCPLHARLGKRSSVESRIFRRFKDRSLPHLGFTPRDDWEWLAVAQHFGLPTRLLDWTANPLIAAFFAVEREGAADSAIFVCEIRAVLDKTKFHDPFAITEVVRFTPPAITDRIVQQSGLFTAHPHPEKAFEPSGMWKLRIPNSERRNIKRELFKLGVSRGVLFPGLDGIAADLTWEGTGIH